MKLSYKWINKYIDLSGITPEVLADKLTAAGFEVEGIERMASGTNLIVGEVLSCERHPDSDHLHVCKVDIGHNQLQIVCGAPNVAAGQKVIVAQVGAVLPDITIKAGMIRGIESQGMICALFELGVDKKLLSADQLAGITILPETANVGDEQPLAYVGMDDVILDVSLTPNRVDCLSMWAMAYEIAAITGREVTLPDVKSAVNCTPAKLQIYSKTDKCQRFIGKIINKLTLKDSPKWMKEALNSVGIKSINNIVDISNYVMVETGQPLHFYDLAKIPAKEITVRADLELDYTALDGIVYAIKPGDIMITTAEQAIGIAGIMGGDDSKISPETSGIIIEAAIFDLASIRMTSRRLNLATEASIRFQKGVEPLAPKKAVDRAVELLIELADAEQIEESVVIGDFDDQGYSISLTVGYINRFLATNFTSATIMKVFRSLNLNPVISDEEITVRIPSYRTDLRLPVDLTEEVIRLLGYDHVPATIPPINECYGSLAANEDKRYVIKDLLKDLGGAEIVTYSLVAQRYIEPRIMPFGTAVALANPISEDKKYFRTALLPSMLETIAYNQARYVTEFSLFEIANVYSNEGQLQERLSLAMSTELTSSKWKHQQEKRDFYTLKGQLTAVLESLGYEKKRLMFKELPAEYDFFNPYQSAQIFIEHTLVGVLGVLHPLRQKEWNVGECLLAELNLSAIYEIKAAKVKFKPIPRFPSVNYDLALIVDQTVNAGEMSAAIKKCGGKLITDVEIFDVYQGENLPDGTKSVAFSITYQSMDRTLTDQDIQPIQKDIISTLRKQFQASWREN
ncbi:MAG: phenylalanine--tRNA ligase subunit beta [Erysipelotrichaceae bacterium]|nr:phenylalanine--tRNA ligase subunit beta [Erysipelotrichaceae bacterium]